jgi:NADH-quinone oxidoreductase subunit F
MLFCAIPSYRLPKETIQKEIDSILNENITIKYNTVLGKDISINSLFKDGYQAILLAMGAHKSKALGIENENVKGVLPSIDFLKDFNLKGKSLARGKVGVIGGGNSAIDAARTALRQKDVKNVTLVYRRSRKEMPAFEEEIEAAEQEGVKIKTLISPTKIIAKDGNIIGLECISNVLGDLDASGRRHPVAVNGTEHILDFDTLIVAISEDSGKDCVTAAKAGGVETTKKNTVNINDKTMLTNREGVFAAGDVVTGPNTVIDAIATGKKAAVMIDRFITGELLEQPAELDRPKVYIKPIDINMEALQQLGRVEIPRARAEWRKRNFSEVEVSLSVEEARQEALRCLRCDLEFTQPGCRDEKKQTRILQEEVTDG